MGGRKAGGPRFLGQGLAATTVLDGDVTIGLRRAVADLQGSLRRIGLLSAGEELTWGQMLAASSAAGGLRMTVHGLVHDMTVKAAREAALGAGAILKMVTAGVLDDRQLAQVAELRPNILFLAGGVDHGERATVVENARRLAELVRRTASGRRASGPARMGGPGRAAGAAGWRAPVIFAGNADARDEVLEILSAAGIKVFSVENVYPRIDELNVEPARRVIQEAFEEHIVVAPGMDSIRQMVTGRILPTPGAVMTAAQALYGRIGDLVAFDVGGATTDVHSVSEGSDEVQRLAVAPEPLAKRTVEGDLGVYLNAGNIVELAGAAGVARVMDELGDPATAGEVKDLAARRPLFPANEREQAFVAALTAEATRLAVLRHAGGLRYLYGPTGRTTVAEGKDLTLVKWLIGTGGPLTRLSAGPWILRRIPGYGHGRELLPRPGARELVDRHYVMAACGVLAAAGLEHDATEILLGSLGLNAFVEVTAR